MFNKTALHMQYMRTIHSPSQAYMLGDDQVSGANTLARGRRDLRRELFAAHLFKLSLLDCLSRTDSLISLAYHHANLYMIYVLLLLQATIGILS